MWLLELNKYVIVLILEVLYYSLFMKFARKEGNFVRYLIAFTMVVLIAGITNVQTVLSYGGDTGTKACIVGSMAEAMYGIENRFIKKAKEYIPNDFIEILEREYKKREDIER